jgi:lysophospholipase L1-like esterase
MGRVYLVGDSWVKGAAGRTLAEALRAEGNEVERDGVVGRTSRTLLADAGVRRRLRAFRPSMVLVVLGVNDTPGENLVERYRALGAHLAFPGATLLLLPNTQAREPWATRIRAVMEYQRRGWPAGLLSPEGLATTEDYDGSGYHLSREGAARWAPRVLVLLKARPPVSVLDRVGRALLSLVPGGL